MRLIVLILIIYLSQGINGQTFNKRFDLSSPDCLFGSVVVTDSMYYITGTKIDSLAPFLPHGFFAGMDLDGEIQFLSFERDTQNVKFRGKPYLHELNKDFIVSGYTSEGIGFALLTKINPYGEILWEKKYESYYANVGENFIATLDIALDTDNSIYLLTNVAGPSSGNSHSLIKTDSIGNLIWNKILEPTNKRTSSRSITLSSEGDLWVTSLIIDTHPSLDTLEYQNQITKIDTAGNVLWNFITPTSQGQIGWVGGLVEASDGGIIINALNGYENFGHHPRRVEWEKYIYKISEEGELAWELEIPAPWLTTGTEAWRMIKVSDGSGYIAVSNDLHYSGIDGDSISYKGWLGKIDDLGNLLWARTYTGINSHKNTNLLYDVKETSDGGFVAVGYSKDRTVDTLARQAWIIKTDEYGCIVPDCHLTSTYEPDAWQGRILLYPNPVKDYLNLFFQSQEATRNMTFSIVNLQGQVVQQFQPSANEVTMMVDVNHYAAGQYYLVLEQAGRILWREGFVKIE